LFDAGKNPFVCNAQMLIIGIEFDVFLFRIH
jgi:hypothetical protein